MLDLSGCGNTIILCLLEIIRRSYANGFTESSYRKNWWAYMTKIVETDTGNSPLCTQLSKVFHMSLINEFNSVVVTPITINRQYLWSA